jgi:Tfp pilus assembly protein PilV
VNRKSRGESPGFLLLDGAVALMLLGVGVFAAVVFFRTEVRELRGQHEQFAALLIAESEMERLRALPYDEMRTDENAPLALPAAKQLREARGRILVTEIEDGLKSATVRVEWRTPSGIPMHAEAAGLFAREGRP